MPNTLKVGFFSLTEVGNGCDSEYNESRLFDNLRLEGMCWARRWVATPELMERRLFARGDLAKSQRVSLYLISEPVTTALDEFQKLGRFFQARRSPLTGLFTLVKTYAAPRLTIDPDAILDWPNRGLFVTAQDRVEGATAAAFDEARQWYDEVHIPDLLGVHGAAGCWWFEAMPDAVMPDRPNPSGRTIRVYWLDEDPNAFLDDLRERTPGMSMMDLSNAYRTLLVGAYRTIPLESSFDWFD